MNIEYSALGGHVKLVKRMMEAAIHTRHSYRIPMFDVKPIILNAVRSGCLPLLKYLMTRSWHHYDLKLMEKAQKRGFEENLRASENALVREALALEPSLPVANWLRSRMHH